MIRVLSVLLLTLFLFPIFPRIATADTGAVSVSADDWARPRSAARVVQLPGLGALLAAFERQPQGRLVIHHAGGDDGSLWAEELRSWLVALGIPSSRIALQSDATEPDRLTLALHASGRVP
jgi:hypothetical protein